MSSLTEEMVLINGGKFVMGNDKEEYGFAEDLEQPTAVMEVDDFYIDKTSVTNDQFLKFVEQTGYTTVAEKYGDSTVFQLLIDENDWNKYQRNPMTPWWFLVPGAYWKHPEGPDSTIEDRMDHPVVHIAYEDAQAYAKWAGKKIPTEIQWEYAARGGKSNVLFPWGDELLENGKHNCNIFQGDFPNLNTIDDGYLATAPADHFYTNDYGVTQMIGNVWEWCDNVAKTQIKDIGIAKELLPASEEFAIRGGSFLCHASYCKRYRVFSRNGTHKDNTASNMGFRCIVEIEK